MTIKVKKKIINRLKTSTRPAFYNTLKFKSFSSIPVFFLFSSLDITLEHL